MMESMRKIMAFGSHFELVKSDRLPSVKVVQIWPDRIHVDSDGDEAFLCEVINESEDE